MVSKQNELSKAELRAITKAREAANKEAQIVTDDLADIGEGLERAFDELNLPQYDELGRLIDWATIAADLGLADIAATLEEQKVTEEDRELNRLAAEQARLEAIIEDTRMAYEILLERWEAEGKKQEDNVIWRLEAANYEALQKEQANLAWAFDYIDQMQESSSRELNLAMDWFSETFVALLSGGIGMFFNLFKDFFFEEE